MTTSPSSCSVEMLWPSRVTSVAAGARAPTFRSLAQAARARRPPRPHTLEAAMRCRSARRVSLEGVAPPDGRRPAREQLVAIEPTVNRQLREAEDMQAVHDTQRNPWTQERDGARRVRGVGEGALVGALVQQIHLQLRHPARMRLVAKSHTHRGGVAGPEVVAGLVLLVRHRALEL